MASKKRVEVSPAWAWASWASCSANLPICPLTPMIMVWEIFLHFIYLNYFLELFWNSKAYWKIIVFYVTICYLIQSQKLWDFPFFSSIIYLWLVMKIMFQLSLIILITIFININYWNGHMVPFNPINTSLSNHVLYTEKKYVFYAFHFSFFVPRFEFLPLPIL